MKVGYSDFLKLCRVDNDEDWCPWLLVRPDGVYVKKPHDDLPADQRAALSEHPTGNLDEPALRFPCALHELQEFLETFGPYGCIDAFDMAKWVRERCVQQAETERNPHISSKLAKLNQAASKFWSNADRVDRATHPDNQMVAAWLVGEGFSETLADKAATIIRPDWVPSGRKPEE